MQTLDPGSEGVGRGCFTMGRAHPRSGLATYCEGSYCLPRSHRRPVGWNLFAVSVPNESHGGAAQEGGPLNCPPQSSLLGKTEAFAWWREAISIPSRTGVAIAAAPDQDQTTAAPPSPPPPLCPVQCCVDQAAPIPAAGLGSLVGDGVSHVFGVLCQVLPSGGGGGVPYVARLCCVNSCF